MLSKQSKFWIQSGATLGGLAVVTGALAAHGLEEYLLVLYQGVYIETLAGPVAAASKYLADFKTAAEYQTYHALALVCLGLIPQVTARRLTTIAGWSFILGIFLFCGSLYALVLTGATRFGMITPVGGLSFIVGWLCLALTVAGKSDQ